LQNLKTITNRNNIFEVAIRNANFEPFKYFLWVFLLFSANAVQAQTIIKGRLQSNDKKPIISGTVTLNDSINGNILAYAISNIEGAFTIEVRSAAKEFILQVRAFNFATEIRTISNQSGEYNFTLTPKPTELPNVVVKPPPVSQRGDTLNYTVSEYADQKKYADQKDRSIADVLRKMPGIEIQGDGRVLYQGKPIQKYYIEGMDLLEGRYNLANQNLPHASVNSVQILENHQPIRVLDSLVPTDRASLNIKLKNNITVTGSGRAGIGASPLLWDAAATPMLFKKNIQAITSYQSNNIGDDLARQLKTLTIENLLEQLDGFGPAAQTLMLIEPNAPPISSKRYLDNNTHMITANVLNKLDKDLELRVNASYLNDYQRRIGLANTIFFTPDGDIFLEERMANDYFIRELNTQFTLQKNTPKGFLKNMLTINSRDNSGRGLVQNLSDTIAQKLDNPFREISNHLRWITPIGKQLVSLSSQIHYDNMPHRLSLSPGVFANILNLGQAYPLLQQSFSQQHFNTHHFAEITKAKGAFTFMPRLGLLTTHQQMESNANTGKVPENDLAENDINTGYMKPYAKMAVSLKKPRWDAQLTMPVSAHFFTLKDMVKQKEQQDRFVTFDPLLFANYKLNGKWRITASASYLNSFQNFNRIFSGLVVDNYRSIRVNNLPIAQVKSISASTGIYFRNPIKAVFSHLIYQFSQATQPFLPDNQINPDGSMETFVLPFENNIQSHSVQLKVSKYITPIKTTITGGADLSYATGNLVLNGTPTQSINRSIRPSLKLHTRLGQWFAYDYVGEVSFSDNQLEGQEKNNFQFLSQSLQLHFYPAKNQYLGLSGEHFFNNTKLEKTNIVYPDVTYRYTLLKKKVDFQLTLMNLLNEQYYITTSFNDFAFYQHRFFIRPRQAVVSVKFQF
jgi:hypothetical protein